MVKPKVRFFHIPVAITITITIIKMPCLALVWGVSDCIPILGDKSKNGLTTLCISCVHLPAKELIVPRQAPHTIDTLGSWGSEKTALALSLLCLSQTGTVHICAKCI